MLTYTEVSDRLGDMDIDKDQMDDIYDSLMNKGIEVSMESEPDDIGLMEMDECERVIRLCLTQPKKRKAA